ncbi:sensor histidine kinase [Paraglaciecola hydrolytica]|uniref:histidine kinase n=1 Tax=Paraglaciecola hydrolytica TaxID=1799789 RepID=A0A136A0B3_9ALTE|nr:histidine kinase dimerization/phospho-acceptor domain-containing protein [Paraglaciecola hydrolytica]KXI28637.1 hypothetical protein AX660_16265 [Paraglaciecola hydrolytica]
MPVKHPLRRRTILLFVGFTMLLGALFTAGSFVIAYVIEDELIDRLLMQEISYLQQADNASMFPRYPYFSVHQSVNTMPSNIVEALQLRPNIQEIFTADQSHYHLRQFLLADKPSYLLAEVSSLLTVSQHRGQISMLMLYISLFAIALAAWIAFKIANYTSRPLVRLTDELAKYPHTHSQITLSAATQNNEIGYLANAIQSTMNELSFALQRETEFTRDVSHELRTPMTVINNLLQLAHHRGWQAGDNVELQQQLQLMQQVVDVLLTLARQQHVKCERLLLLPIIEDAVLEQLPLLEAAEIQAQIVLPETLAVQGNAQLVRLLLKVLLENSAQHGVKGDVVFRYSNPQLHIENSHVGNNRLREGIGLRLAEKIASSMGWQLHANNTENNFLIIITFETLGAI